MICHVSARFSSCRIKIRCSLNFCEFKELVEKDTGRKLKALRSDNGGEYVLNKFKNYVHQKEFDGS